MPAPDPHALKAKHGQSVDAATQHLTERFEREIAPVINLHLQGDPSRPTGIAGWPEISVVGALGWCTLWLDLDAYLCDLEPIIRRYYAAYSITISTEPGNSSDMSYPSLQAALGDHRELVLMTISVI